MSQVKIIIIGFCVTFFLLVCFLHCYCRHLNNQRKQGFADARKDKQRQIAEQRKIAERMKDPNYRE